MTNVIRDINCTADIGLKEVGTGDDPGNAEGCYQYGKQKCCSEHENNGDESSYHIS